MNIKQLFGIASGHREKTAIKDVMEIFFPSSQQKITDHNQAYKQNVWISRGIKVKSETASSVPWHIVDKNKEPMEELEHKFSLLSPAYTDTEMKEKTFAWESLFGYSVWYYELNHITLIDADQVEVKVKNGLPIYRFIPTQRRLDSDKIFVFPNFSPYASVTGVSDIQACLDVANLEESAIQLTSNILSGGGMLQGILSTDQNLTPDEADFVKARFREKYSGIGNAGSVGIFGRGLKWQKIGVSPSDFSALDISSLTRNQIAAAVGVPEIYLMNTEAVDYANSKTQERMFYQTTIKPMCDRFADRLTRFVLPIMFKTDCKFMFDWEIVDALKPDRLLQSQADEIDIRSGKRLINELRERDGLDAVPYGDQWWGPISQIPLSESKTMEKISIKLEAIEKQLKINKKVDTVKIWKMFVSRTAPQEKRLKTELKKLFEKQEKEALEGLKSFIPEVKGETKGIKDLINFTKWVEIFRKAEKPFILAFMEQAGNQTVADYGLNIAFDLQNAEVQKWIEEKTFKFAKEVNETTQEALRKTLKEGSAAGEGIPELSKRVSNVFEQAKDFRTDRIARTEVIGCNNKASLEAAKQNGMEKKIWLTAIDENTRPEHVAADGQEVDIDKPFIVDGEELEEPGDPAGSPGNIINCRCTLRYGG